MRKKKDPVYSLDYLRKRAEEVANLGIDYIKNGTGYDEFKASFNKLCVEDHSNVGVDLAYVINWRRLTANQVYTNSIPFLIHPDLDKLHDILFEFAEDFDIWKYDEERNANN